MTVPKTLTVDDLQLLQSQNSRLVPRHKVKSLTKEARKHWDLFYKRNETRFFRDRRWTTREFVELVGDLENQLDRRVLLEVGCGVGNFVFPLIEEKRNLYIHACDFSPRAVEFVKSNSLYDEKYIKAFVCDITTDTLLSAIEHCSVDIATLIFVLSALHPNNFIKALTNVYKVITPGGLVLFRDYGLYDMAQLRFKPGHKIDDNFYMRQDGTLTYYFSVEGVSQLFAEAGFHVVTCEYVYRRTVNKKEGIDVQRIFVQGKFQKPK